MTRTRTTDELAARRKPESPDKVRWMLWLPRDTLAALKAEAEDTGEPMAQIVRDATEARVHLGRADVTAYREEAVRRNVPVSTVLRDALVAGVPAIGPLPLVADAA